MKRQNTTPNVPNSYDLADKQKALYLNAKPTVQVTETCLVPTTQSPLWTSSEVMALLRVNRATLCRYCRDGVIPHMRMPDSTYRFDRNQVLKWIDDRSINTDQEKAVTDN